MARQLGGIGRTAIMRHTDPRERGVWRRMTGGLYLMQIPFTMDTGGSPEFVEAKR